MVNDGQDWSRMVNDERGCLKMVKNMNKNYQGCSDMKKDVPVSSKKVNALQC